MTSEPPPSYPSAPPPPSFSGPAPQAFYYRPLQARLTALKVVFWIIVATSLIAAVSDVLTIQFWGRFLDGETISDSQADAEDIRAGLAALLQFGAWVAGVVVFLMWLFRAYQNTDGVAPGTRRYGHGWAIGGWFVPIMNLWRPKQVVNDIWRAGGHPPEPSGLIQWWWGLWLLTNFVANIGTRAAFGDEEPEDLRSSAIAYLVSDLLDAITAVLAIAVATTLTRRLDARAAEGPPQTAWAPPVAEPDELGPGRTPPPPPLGSS